MEGSNDNVFVEQLVKHTYTKKDNRTRMIILIITAILIFIWMHNSVKYLAATIFLVVFTIVIAVFAMNFLLNKEYEYTYAEGELDIDLIYNKSRRRRVFTGSIQEFEVIAPYKDKEHLDFYKNFPLRDYSGGLVAENTYVFVASYKGKKARFVIEPNERLLEMLRINISPLKFFTNQQQVFTNK
ncbi:MAG: DUF6106 family protein [Eubacterium sp.]|nr:DUF6106 family protein [Eubacterium sp.]